MSATVAVERREPAARRDRVGAAARATLAVGGTLAIAGLVLVALGARADADVPAADVARQLVRVGSALPLLLLGSLMLARVPRHPIGWILCAAALGALLAFAGAQYAIHAHYVEPLPADDWAGWVGEWAAAPIVLVPAVALLLFPTGAPPSPRWRPWLWCGLAAPALIALEGAFGPGDDLAFNDNPLYGDATAATVGEPFGIGWFMAFPAMFAGIAAIAVRRRSAEGETREQLRLLLRAALVVVVAFVACLIGALATPAAFDVGAFAAVVSLAFLAAAMAVAILRHRLYGLDVFVNRALVFSALTVVLGGVYVAAVLGVGSALGQDVQFGAALIATALVAVAFQPLRDRVQRAVSRLLHGRRDEPYAAISTLGRRLGEAMAPARVLPVMVETIGDELRLPYVAVELADAPDEPAAVYGAPDAGVALRLPLVHAGERVGTLVIGARAHGAPLAEADRRLLEDFARRASAAASAVALSIEVQRSRERLVTAREEERRRLRGDLHDGLGPTLAGAVLTIDAARRVLATDPEAADALLDQAATRIEGTVADVRRLVYGLRPPALDQLGLTGALRQHAAALNGAELDCTISAPDSLPPLPAAVEAAAYRIAQEALTNVARHAHARTAVVSITVGESLHLEVADDGCGVPDDRRAGVGLTSMRERSTELGGSFELAAGAGGGTVVRVELPLPQRSPGTTSPFS
jgi:two-component system, NarL family, sensor kinase